MSDSTSREPLLDQVSEESASPGAQAPQPISDAQASALPVPDTPVAGVQEHLKALSELTLQAGENAARSADVAAVVAGQMKDAAKRLGAVASRSRRQGWILLGAGVSVLIVAAALFLALALRMHDRIQRLDATLLAVGKRAVEMTGQLDTLGQLHGQVQAFSVRQEELMRQHLELAQKVGSTLRSSETVVQQLPQETARQVAATHEGLTRQVSEVQQRLREQTQTVTALQGQLKAMQADVAQVKGVRRDVEALVVLQRERYLEVLQQQSQQAQAAAQAPAPVLLQYPRPRDSDDAARGAQPSP